MRRFTVLLLMLSVLILSGSPLSKERKRLEVSLMGGAALENGMGPVGYISLSWYFLPEVLAFEVNSAFEPSDVVFSGNLSFHIPTQSRVNIFFTGGGGICVHGTPFWNLGGGARIKLQERLSFRADVRYYSYEEEGDVVGILGILAGISYFF